ncbi:3-keto-disaccharide hydrolase [Pedobacter sp. PWIIR3]
MKNIFFLLLFWVAATSFAFAQKVNVLTKSERNKGWILLFDGETTRGWTTTSGTEVPAGWQIVDKTLKSVADGKGGDIVTTAEFSNFELKLDYKVELTANSGVKYFYNSYSTGGNLGMEYQILDDMLAEDNQKANHLTGSLYDILEPSKRLKKLYPAGQWNSIRIVANGKHVEHWLNDYKILEFTRDSKAFTDAVAASKFMKTVPAFGSLDKGKILLQEHGGVVSYRNIKIKKL